MRVWVSVFLFAAASLLAYDPCDFTPLFDEVQQRALFSDSKNFVDRLLLFPAREIAERYSSEHPQSKEELRSFVERYFALKERHHPFPSPKLEMREYIHSAWDALLRPPTTVDRDRSTLLPLPRRYLIAGDRFRELYYWDSYFGMLGLHLSGRADIVEDMVYNFAHLIDRYGFIPNGTRTYYLTRSQPPFFSLMLTLCAHPERYVEQLAQEYAFWIHARRPPGAVLSHYSDAAFAPRPEGYLEDIKRAEELPLWERKALYHEVRAAAESGWDFSSRWLSSDGKWITTHLFPVDLNALLYHCERQLAALYEKLGKGEEAVHFRAAAERRLSMFNEKLWCAERGFYFDYDYVDHRQSAHYTAAAVFPLTFNMATQEQAASVAKIFETQFLKRGGVVTTLNGSGEQWDAPNGWAPLQWAAVVGFRNYGYQKLADEIARRWLACNESVYRARGVMVEKYDVIDPEKSASGGEYALQAGFSWTNGVALFLLDSL